MNLEGQFHAELIGKRTPNTDGEQKRRGPFAQAIDALMQHMYRYLENSDDECQFSMEKLIAQMNGDYKPDQKTVTARLVEKYGDDILLPFRKIIRLVCLKNILGKILNDAFYQQKCKSEEEERYRIVEAAAKIICDYIRFQVYDVKEYPAPDRFMDGTESVISETLKHFISTSILNRKKGRYKEKWKNESRAIPHFIISAVKPRSSLSN
ncbi:hypothetical protein JTB14_034477 [Gonioctena quinquepunctata]|nr:hypothetical protein JTB14_034477 [Gonioctena quinquepunctata]